jgi:hypothetical protein
VDPPVNFAEKAGQFIISLLVRSTPSDVVGDFAQVLLGEVLDVLEFAVDDIKSQVGFEQVRWPTALLIVEALRIHF